MNRRVSMILLLVFMFLASLGANQSLHNVLPQLNQNELDALLQGELLEGQSFNTDIERFAPRDSRAYLETVRALLMDNAFSICALAYIPYPEALQTLSEEERQVALFNLIRAISTQEGLEYISYRAGNKPKTLIEKSYYVDSPKGKVVLPDPVVDTIVPTATSYVYQKDTTFKGNIYRHDYHISQNEIFLDVRNLETMKVLGIVGAVKAEQLSIKMSAHQLEEGVLLYGMATIVDRKPTVSALGIKVDLPSAFLRRVRALHNWFADSVNRYGL